jgi:hypothetical protein
MTMRWFLFLVMLSIGAALGLVYGWVINPVQYVDTPPAALRIDFKSDYVLMVAEAYQADGDLDLAARRLALLGDSPPAELVQEAMVWGSQAPYSEGDMDLLTRLASDLQAWNSLPAVAAPAEGETQP